MNDARYDFASDNCSGICPEALEALLEANRDFAAAYGDDRWTRRAVKLIRELFETDCEVFFTFSGTAANSLALAHLCRPYHGVICHANSHVETDECNAPGFFSGGIKLLPVESRDGRISPEQVEAAAKQRTDVHAPKAGALSTTQSTELGTVYSIDHLQRLGETVRRLKLRWHMDGARFANAIASLSGTPKDVTWQAGVDVLSLGGAKNGLPLGEALVFFDKQLAHEFEYRRKQAGQLASKMRFLTAPWVGLLESGAWLKNAQQANRCAKLLEQELRKLEGVEILCPVEANAVFVNLSAAAIARLRDEGWRFYTFLGETGVRFMCSWSTTEEEVRSFAAAIRAAVAASQTAQPARPRSSDSRSASG